MASKTESEALDHSSGGGVQEPYEYVHDVLRNIGDAQTLEDLEALLPWNME